MRRELPLSLLAPFFFLVFRGGGISVFFVFLVVLDIKSVVLGVGQRGPFCGQKPDGATQTRSDVAAGQQGDRGGRVPADATEGRGRGRRRKRWI